MIIKAECASPLANATTHMTTLIMFVTTHKTHCSMNLLTIRNMAITDSIVVAASLTGWGSLNK